MLLIEAEILLLLVNRPDTRKEFLVEKGIHAEFGHQRRDFLCHSLHLIAGISFHKVIENGSNPVESSTGPLESLYCIGKIRSLGIVGNCVDFSLSLGYALLECRQIMFNLDFIELRSAIRQFGLGKKRIFHFARS